MRRAVTELVDAATDDDGAIDRIVARAAYAALRDLRQFEIDP